MDEIPWLLAWLSNMLTLNIILAHTQSKIDVIKSLFILEII